MNKVEIHKSICDKSHNTYKAKNADYGDSFSKLRQKYPNAILIRLTDKLNRLEVLMNGGQQQVNDESIDDTLLDLATYAIMELTERQFERGVSEIERNCVNCRHEHVNTARCVDCYNAYIASGKTNALSMWEAKEK